MESGWAVAFKQRIGQCYPGVGCDHRSQHTDLAGTRLWVGHGQPTTIRQVAWSPDGKQLASCGYDGSIVLWEAGNGTQLARLQGHHGMVMCVVGNNPIAQGESRWP